MTELDELRLALIRADAAERRLSELMERAQQAVDILAHTNIPAEVRAQSVLVLFSTNLEVV